MSTFLKNTLGIYIIVFLSSHSFAQNITGTWQGNLNVQGNELPLVFYIVKDGTNKLTASFDSPNQKAFNLQCSEVIIKDDSVILMIALIKGKYAGQLSKDKKQIAGSWFQGPGSLPLTINKTSETVTIKEQKRPQTPGPPFPYHSNDVEYFNADKSIKYGATLTYPMRDTSNPGKKSFPAVLLITGSGQQDRDETILGHKPFAVIADNLTKKGFVVLRADDRGMGKTTGDFSQSTSLDFAKDVEAGLDFLEAQPEVNKENIGLLGHSEGGMIAPIVANERKDVKFIILLAGPGIPIIDLMQQQSEAVAIAVGQSPAEAKAGSGLMRLVWEEVNKNQDTATTFKNIRARVEAWTNTLDTATLAKIRSRTTASVDEQIRQAMQAMQAMTSNWFRYFISFDPRPYLQKLQCKVLALNGSRDVQVISSTNLEGIRTSLQKSHSQKYDVIELPGLNHLFQTCIQCSPAEYGELEETFSPKALDLIDNWLQKNIK